MRELEQKRKIRRYLYSWFSLVALAALVFLTAKGAWGVFQKERESRMELFRVTQELAALEVRSAALRGDIERLQTADGLEAEIRKQFQVAKPGEKMVVIVEEEKKGESESVTARPFMSKFFDIFR